MQSAGLVIWRGLVGAVCKNARLDLTLLIAIGLLAAVPVFAQGELEDRTIADVVITFEGADRNASANETFRRIARESLGAKYSTVKVREAIEALYNTGQVASVTVEASANESGVVVRFLIRRKTQAQRVTIELPEDDRSKVTEQELLFRLNLLDPGTAITDQTLQQNANLILEYLRDRGFFKAEVTYTTRPLESETEVGVTFRVQPNAQATVERFAINIVGFDNAKLVDEVNLQPGEPYTREKLLTDIEKIRRILRDNDFLAPTLDEPRVVYNPDANNISITLEGKVGPVVEVEIEAERDRVGSRTQNRLLPIKREGTLDYAAIVEGERRLETHYQEQGYFFVNVTPVCSIEPPPDTSDATV